MYTSRALVRAEGVCSGGKPIVRDIKWKKERYAQEREEKGQAA
jgi:hypothetical protein